MPRYKVKSRRLLSIVSQDDIEFAIRYLGILAQSLSANLAMRRTAEAEGLDIDTSTHIYIEVRSEQEC